MEPATTMQTTCPCRPNTFHDFPVLCPANGSRCANARLRSFRVASAHRADLRCLSKEGMLVRPMLEKPPMRGGWRGIIVLLVTTSCSSSGVVGTSTAGGPSAGGAISSSAAGSGGKASGGSSGATVGGAAGSTAGAAGSTAGAAGHVVIDGAGGGRLSFDAGPDGKPPCSGECQT